MGSDKAEARALADPSPAGVDSARNKREWVLACDLATLDCIRLS